MSLITSLKAQANPLSAPNAQLELLNNGMFEDGTLPRFQSSVQKQHTWPMRPKQLAILQVNLGYMCNQTCKHCHVDAGPDRKEIMTRETMAACLDVIREHNIKTLDLTGGAPEMNPDFRWFVEAARPHVSEIIVRSNLTILVANETRKELIPFFAKNHIHVISSLPFYNADKTDRQRGEGVFTKSITALKALNAEGYGQGNTSLKLDLVYNPNGAFLPAPQVALEAEFKNALRSEFGIAFDELFCITNLPISRFLEYLVRTENYEEYMHKLVEAFNPATVDGLMCKDTLSVGWDGRLFDCDFNQMLEIEVDITGSKHITDFDIDKLNDRVIRVHQHCYGCTAGSGSSCQGTLV